MNVTSAGWQVTLCDPIWHLSSRSFVAALQTVISMLLCLHYLLSYTHRHTHPFNGPLSGTTRVSRYQKGNTNLDFTEARDSEWQWHQLGRMQVCTSLHTDNHANTSPLSFLQAGCPSCRPTNSVKALKAVIYLLTGSKRAQSKMVMLRLFKSYCLTFVLYATEVMQLSKHSLKLLIFCVAKIFNTYDRDCIN